METIDRIQGATVDYAIVYIPGRNPGFALDERRFNVATSRSRSTTLIISDIPPHFGTLFFVSPSNVSLINLRREHSELANALNIKCVLTNPIMQQIIIIKFITVQTTKKG